jgi:hypothetical protein
LRRRDLSTGRKERNTLGDKDEETGVNWRELD